MNHKIFRIKARGQALLTLLFFIIIALTVTSASVVMIFVNSLSGTTYQQGTIAYEVAQSGADNALLRLLRDPTYTGETLPVGSGSAVITVTGSNPYVILSKGSVGNSLREIQVTASYSADYVLQVISQKEVF